MSSLTWTARWFPMPLSALSTPVVTEYGLPLCHRMSGAICQSPNTASRALFENAGESHTTDVLTTWRRSESDAEEARSAFFGWVMVGPVSSVVAGSLMHLDSV